MYCFINSSVGSRQSSLPGQISQSAQLASRQERHEEKDPGNQHRLSWRTVEIASNYIVVVNAMPRLDLSGIMIQESSWRRERVDVESGRIVLLYAVVQWDSTHAMYMM